MKWAIILTFLTTASGFFHTASYINQKIRSCLPKNQIKKENIQQKAVDEQTTINNYIQKFDMSWYVVAEKNEINSKKPYKVTVWGKDYVIWKTSQTTYTALEDVCPHKGAAFSVGTIENGRIVCPYHGYEFDQIGNLTVIPGLCFQPSNIYNVPRFAVVEKNGWIYLNTWEVLSATTDEHIQTLADRIFVEPELETEETKGSAISGTPLGNKMKVLFINQVFKTYPRIVTENSLDIMHIAFVHTFGNKVKPSPSHENPPKEIGPGHWRTSYVYESGKDSMVSRLFKFKRIDIENEFVLPHTSIARIAFGPGLINTVVTAACPINEHETKLFVKTYRNFLLFGFLDNWFYSLMKNTLNQDKRVIESIKRENIDGKFNMKFDKLQNTYRTLYKKFVRD
jgi:phenylpropionate dioxygenase-like ring-hydroxylating dioxygenase large terminal subunit